MAISDARQTPISVSIGSSLLGQDPFEQGAGGEHVLPRERPGAARAACCEGVEQRPVLPLVRAVELVQLARIRRGPDGRAGVAGALGDPLDHRQAGDAVDHVVEGVVGANPLGDEVGAPVGGQAAAAAQLVGEPREAILDRLQLVEVGARHPLRRDLGREALELRPDEKRLAQLGAGQRADADAAVGLERDEAERRQAAKRLADGRAADAVPSRQLLLAQHGSRRELPRDDRLLQLERDVVRLGACRLGHGR